MKLLSLGKDTGTNFISFACSGDRQQVFGVINSALIALEKPTQKCFMKNIAPGYCKAFFTVNSYEQHVSKKNDDGSSLCFTDCEQLKILAFFGTLIA